MRLRFFKDISQVPQEETILYEPTSKNILHHIDLLCSALDFYRRIYKRRNFKRGIKCYKSFEEFLRDKDEF